MYFLNIRICFQMYFLILVYQMNLVKVDEGSKLF